MSKLAWDKVGKRYYEVGVDRGVLYPEGGGGVSWNGLLGITETPVGGEATPYFLDGVKYLNDAGLEEFAATIEAYTYPEEFAVCDGTLEASPGVGVGNQDREPFGLSYRTRVGSDTKGMDFGYKIHLVYNALAVPSEIVYASLSDDPETTAFSWDITTTPEEMPGYLPTAHVSIDTTKTDADVIAEIEYILYGSEGTPPRMMYLTELVAMYSLELLRIAESPRTGLSMLKNDGRADVRRDPSMLQGYYSKSRDSRLTQTAISGLYKLES